MAREPNIPLFLWIATAVLVHLVGGQGADRAAEVLEERADIRQFADAVRRYAHLRGGPIEVALLEQEPPDDEALDVPSDRGEPEPGTPETSPEDTKEPVDPAEPEKKDEPEERDSEDSSEPKEPKKKDEPPEPEKKDEPKEPEDDSDTPFPKLDLDNRIAVVQHVEDENQKDNPDAEFIGDQANHVEEQTQARITATDQNAAKPNPGSSFQTPAETPGNSHVTDIAHSEDAPGQVDRAPNETSSGAEPEAVARYQQPKGGGSPHAKMQADSKSGDPDGQSSEGESGKAATKSPGRSAVAASEGAEAAPETVQSENGRFNVERAREAREARRAQGAQKRQLPKRRGHPDSPMEFLGLGADGTTRGGVNLNLSPHAAVAAVGRDQLERERQADGERRRSKHRGSWKTVGLERWRAAIENYNSSVKPGNQTALNTARVPFASYLNKIHNRLHPIFADSFLDSLDDLPKTHPLSRPELKTNLEIVLDRHQGKIVKMGVTRSSGSTVFDIAALESVQSASPFGKAPPSIVSPDGNVYLHWEFHRNPFYACSTYFARPFKLKVDPKSAPPEVEPGQPPFGPRDEQMREHGYRRSGPESETYAAR